MRYGGYRALVVEHLIPRSRGGDDSAENTALACHKCNTAKANMTPMEWALVRAGIFWRIRRLNGYQLEVDYRFTRPDDGRRIPFFRRDIPSPRAKRARAT